MSIDTLDSDTPALPVLAGGVKRRLKAIGQKLDTQIRVGKSGITPSFLDSLNEALDRMELVKVRFEQFKEEKQELAIQLASSTGSHLVQRVGHTALLFRRQSDPEKRVIKL